MTAHPACPVRGIHRPQFQAQARRKSHRPRLPIHFGFWLAIQLAPRDFARIDRAMRQGKEAQP
jgi:hypothetical protein